MITQDRENSFVPKMNKPKKEEVKVSSWVKFSSYEKVLIQSINQSFKT